MVEIKCVIKYCDWQLEEAAQEVADEVTRPRPVGEETVQDIQVMLKSDAHPASIRSLKVRSKNVFKPVLQSNRTKNLYDLCMELKQAMLIVIINDWLILCQL